MVKLILLLALGQVPPLPQPQPVPTPPPDIQVINGVPLDLQKVPSKANGFELTPASVTVPPTKRAVVITCTMKADTQLGWFVTNDPHSEPIEYIQIKGLPCVVVFPNNKEETINVYAFGSSGGTPVLLRSQITVKNDGKPGPGPVPDPGPGPAPGPGPGPGPAPEPKQLPAGTQLHFTVVYDAKVNNPLVKNAEVERGLLTRKHSFWLYDSNTMGEALKIKGFDTFIQRTAKLPMYIVQDQRGVILDYGALEGTPASVLAILDKIAPPR